MSLARKMMMGASGAETGATFWRVRVDDIAVTLTDYVQITELEFRSTTGGADQTSAAEAGTRATASSEQSATYSPDKAFDEDFAGFPYWWSDPAASLPQWIAWEFATPIVINEVEITRNSGDAGNSEPVEVTIQSSADGITWNDEWTEAGLTYTSDKTTTTRP